MESSEIQAIIPVGFNYEREADLIPSELFLVDNISLLSRALWEVANAGILKATIVAPNFGVAPNWLEAIVAACVADLSAVGMLAPEVEKLFIRNCYRMDDALRFAIACSKTNWVALICPLIQFPDLNGLNQLIGAAKTSGLPIVGVAETSWETAIQLCKVSQSDESQLQRVDLYCPVTDRVTVFSGRAILPILPYSEERCERGCVFENEEFMCHLLTGNSKLPTFLLSGEVTDFRFSGKRPLAQILPWSPGQQHTR